MNPLEVFNRVTGSFRIISFFIGMGFIGWVLYVNVSGPSMMGELNERTESARVEHAELRRIAERDVALARDGWGSDARRVTRIDDTDPGDYGEPTADFLNDEEDDWGFEN